MNRSQETSNLDLRKDYVKKANDFTSIKNISLAAAAVTWIWSTIDAVSTKGATKYAYQKPLHMGGSRRSRRNHHKSSVTRYEQEVDFIDGAIEDLFSQLRMSGQRVSTRIMDSDNSDDEMPGTLDVEYSDSDSDWDDAEEVEDDDDRETTLEQLCGAMRKASNKLTARL